VHKPHFLLSHSALTAAWYLCIACWALQVAQAALPEKGVRGLVPPPQQQQASSCDQSAAVRAALLQLFCCRTGVQRQPWRMHLLVEGLQRIFLGSEIAGACGPGRGVCDKHTHTSWPGASLGGKG